jgi:hypothetical protein
MVEPVPVVVGAALVELHVVVVEVTLGKTGSYVLQGQDTPHLCTIIQMYEDLIRNMMEQICVSLPTLPFVRWGTACFAWIHPSYLWLHIGFLSWPHPMLVEPVVGLSFAGLDGLAWIPHLNGDRAMVHLADGLKEWKKE